MKTIVLYLLLCAGTALPAQSGQWDLLIKDVEVYTGVTTLANTDIAIRDGRIAAMGPRLSAGQAARVLDANGKTLVPGLVNSHVHLWFPMQLQQAAQAGVTSVCDMHGPAYSHTMLAQYRDSVGYAYFRGAGSGATVPGGHGTQFGIVVPTIDSTTSARQFTLDRIAEGSDYIKVLREPMLPTITYEQIDTVVQTAHAAGVKVVAHVSRCEDGVKLAELGVDGLVHLWFDRAMTEKELAVFAEREDFFIVPTLLTNLKLVEMIAQNPARNYEGLDSMQLLTEIERLHQVGVQVLAGTDPPNFMINYSTDLYKELYLLVQAGIPNEVVLHGATTASARFFAIPERHEIAVGHWADFVLLHQSPLQNMRAWEGPKTVYIHGQVVE